MKKKQQQPKKQTRSSYEVSAAQRKIILLRARVKELLECSLVNPIPIRANEEEKIYLTADNENQMIIVDDLSHPDRPSAKNPDACHLSVKVNELDAWASGSVSAKNHGGKTKMDILVRELWPKPEHRKEEDKKQISDRKFNKLCKKWKPSEEEVEPISDDSIGPMEFASAIGFSCARARFILDRAYQNKPSFHVFVMPSDDADKFVEEFGGAYFVYRAEETDWTRQCRYPSGILIRSVLVIRYPVPFRTFEIDETENYVRIQCKYVIPQINKKNPKNIYKYDGYCAPGREKSGSWQWLFQQRKSDVKEHQPDILMMYTGEFVEEKDERTAQVVTGDLLTEYQGSKANKKTAHLSSRILMIRVPEMYSRKVASAEAEYGSPHIALHKRASDGSCQIENEHVFMRENTRIIDLSEDIKDDPEYGAYDRIALRRLVVLK